VARADKMADGHEDILEHVYDASTMSSDTHESLSPNTFEITKVQV
jgi:hypothetical protein